MSNLITAFCFELQVGMYILKNPKEIRRNNRITTVTPPVSNNYQHAIQDIEV